MELEQAIASRRMTRRFDRRSVEPELLERLLGAALRAPSAGFAQGVDLLLLESDDARRRFWDLTSTARWRAESPQAPGLLAAPHLVLPIARPQPYVARYAAADKAGSDLAGLEADEWPVPYWLVDASFATMSLLLAAAGAGLGSLFFRLRCDPRQLLGEFAAPDGCELIGAVALGWPAPPACLEEALQAGRGREAARGAREGAARPARRTLDEALHRDRW